MINQKNDTVKQQIVDYAFRTRGDPSKEEGEEKKVKKRREEEMKRNGAGKR